MSATPRSQSSTMGKINKLSARRDPPGALLQALGGMPKDVAWVNFVASQDEEDEYPLMDLQFFEAGNYEAISTLHLDMDSLKDIHSRLGAVMRKFS